MQTGLWHCYFLEERKALFSYVKQRHMTASPIAVVIWEVELWFSFTSNHISKHVKYISDILVLLSYSSYDFDSGCLSWLLLTLIKTIIRFMVKFLQLISIQQNQRLLGSVLRMEHLFRIHNRIEMGSDLLFWTFIIYVTLRKWEVSSS